MPLASLFDYTSELADALCNATSAFKGYYHSYGYDHGLHGKYPTRRYRSSDVESPRLNVLASSAKCANSLYTFFTPRGLATREPQAMILDRHGELVWTTGWEGQQIYNLMVQEYRGENYLTFWAGSDAVGGHGAGYYYMLDKHYQLFRKIPAASGLDADLHDFRITPEGTAVITVYELVQADLSPLQRPWVGSVWDCIVQEIDLETGALVFQWRALDHYNVGDTIRDDFPAGQGQPDGAEGFDFFHLNSIAKDDAGNYLVSARFVSALTYVNGTSGDVIWIMGGKRNMFTDLSGGKATNFMYQHDARWITEFTGSDVAEISVFDNGVDDNHRTRADTRGLRLRVDRANMTVDLIAEYKHPHRFHSISQGSFQALPPRKDDGRNEGTVLLGYGNAGAWTEYSADGEEILCDAHFGPEKGFGSGEVQSYRVYKYAWHGFPLTSPNVTIHTTENTTIATDADGDADHAHREQNKTSSTTNLYISWNGATEVRRWRIQSEDSSGMWSDIGIGTLEKTGFETVFELPEGCPEQIRVLALDGKGEVLGTAGPVHTGNVGVWTAPTDGLEMEQTSMVWLTSGIVGLFLLGLGLRTLRWVITRCRAWWSRSDRVLKPREQSRGFGYHQYRPVPGVVVDDDDDLEASAGAKRD